MKWFEDRERNSLKHYNTPDLILMVVVCMLVYFLFAFFVTLNWIYG